MLLSWNNISLWGNSGLFDLFLFNLRDDNLGWGSWRFWNCGSFLFDDLLNRLWDLYSLPKFNSIFVLNNLLNVFWGPNFFCEIIILNSNIVLEHHKNLSVDNGLLEILNLDHIVQFWGFSL